MATEVNILGRVRAAVRDVFSAGDARPVLADGGEQIIVQGLPPEAEIARMGQTYVSVGSAVTAVAAIPTTAAHFSLFNGEVAGGKSYVISAVGAVCTTSAAAASIAQLLAHMGCAAETNPAGSIAIKGLHGKAYRGLGNAKASVSITNSGVWHPVGQSVVCAAAATIGLGVYQDVYGRYVLPPQQIFSLATLNSTAAGSFAPFVIWHEVQLSLG